MQKFLTRQITTGTYLAYLAPKRIYEKSQYEENPGPKRAYKKKQIRGKSLLIKSFEEKKTS